MSTLTFKATEMKDAQVARISLVDRAATRIPFKVIKQENPMKSTQPPFDLASVFKREPKIEKPQVVGVVTMKSDDLDAITSVISSSGFLVAKSEEMEDGSIVFAQADSIPDSSILLRLSDTAVVVAKGLKPAIPDLTFTDGVTFSEMIEDQGFYPGVGSMVDVLKHEVLALASKSESPEAAAVMVAKAFDDVSAYVVSLVHGLPSNTFKLEEATKAFKPFVKGQKPGAAPGVTEDGAAPAEGAAEEAPAKPNPFAKKNVAEKACDTKHTASEDGKPVEKAADPKANPFAKKPVEGAAGEAGETATEAAGEAAGGVVAEAPVPSKKPNPFVKKSEIVHPGLSINDVTMIVDAKLGELVAKMETLMGGIAQSVGAMDTSIRSLSNRVSDAELVAKSAREAVSGTLVVGSTFDDHVAVARKHEHRSQEIDTGFAPRRVAR